MSQTQTSSQSDFQSRIPFFLPGGVSRYNLVSGVLFTAVGLGLMAIGWNWGIIQQYRLTKYQPTAARVILSQVQESKGRGTTFTPVIVYQYSVKGMQYQCSRVRASGDPSAPEAESRQLVAQHPAGSTCAAWYNTHDPSSAFIDREVEAAPYGFALIPAFLVTFGIYAIVVRIQTGRPIAPPILDSTRWYRITEDRSFRARIRLGIIGVIGWYSYGGAIIADYLYLNREFDLAAFFFVFVVVFGGMMFLRPTLRNWKLRRDFLEPDVHLSQPQVRPGDTIQLRFRQELIRPLEIKYLSLGLVCIQDKLTHSTRGADTVSSAEFWSQWKDLEVNRTYQRGSAVEVDGHFALPRDAVPTSPWPSRNYPLYRWQISLGIVATGQPKLAARFPIIVEPAQ